MNFLQSREFVCNDVVAEQFFAEVRYSNGHDDTINWVRDGVVDLGAVNSAIHASMIDEGSLGADSIRTVESTRPYQNYVWATRPGLQPDTRLALRDAFLGLDPSEPDHAEILRRVQAGGYLPVDSSAFDRLHALAGRLELLGKAR